MSKSSRLAIGCVSSVFLSASALGQALPRLWTGTNNQTVPSNVQSDARFIRIIKADPRNSTSQQVAQSVCNDFRTWYPNYPTTPAYMTIKLSPFGADRTATPYLWHPSDKLANSGGQPWENEATPWPTAGLVAATNWVEQFITEYRRQQGLYPSKIAPMGRVELDTEDAFLYVSSSAHWNAIKADSRYDTLPVLGNANPLTQAPRTMKKLWEDAGSPAYGTVAFSKFIGTVGRNLISSFMTTALFEPMRQAFPDVQCVDYNFITADGVTDANTPPFIARAFTAHDPVLSGRDAERYASRAVSSRSGPSIYGPFSTTFCEPVAPFTCYPGGVVTGGFIDQGQLRFAPESAIYNTVLRYARHQLESIRQSGVPGSGIEPFVHLHTGIRMDSFVFAGAPTSAQGKDLLRRVLSICRAAGVQDYRLFAPPSTDLAGLTQAQADARDFARFQSCVDQVWSADITGTSMMYGSSYDGTPARLRQSDWQVARAVGLNSAAQLDTTFSIAASATTPQKVRINVEYAPDSTTLANHTLTVEMYQFSTGTWMNSTLVPPIPTTSWDPGPTADGTSSPRRISSFEFTLGTNTAPYIQTVNGVRTMRARVSISNSAGSTTPTHRVDLVQLIALDP